jgi:RNA polymerase sigma-70 factor (ECF subfamily)
VAAWNTDRDAVAFSELVARHLGLMRRAAFVTLGTAAARDPSLVDDVVQEACARLLSALGLYRGDAEPSTFIAAVTRRAALDELRKRLRHRARVNRVMMLAGAEPTVADDPSEALARAAEADELLAALGSLPEPDRSLLYLRDAEGHDVVSLAAAFGLPVGTVKSKLARSRDKVRRAVGRAGEAS